MRDRRVVYHPQAGSGHVGGGHVPMMADRQERMRGRGAIAATCRYHFGEMVLLVDGDSLVVHLSWGEKLWGFHRDLRVPLTSIVGVRPNPKPWLNLRGWRASGVNLQGKFARGTRRHGEGWDLVFLTEGGQAIDIDLATGRYSKITVSVPDAGAEVARIAAAAGIAPGL